ncbi:hypothetical protein [Paenibacillus sp. PL2-23]|uniref:hypothetical protein n=1 Tax=Paenibacillus sp. PL2-23 TaxID=2100729 RepID=UPI0030F96F75
MLLRKALSAYITSFAIVIYYSLLLTGAAHSELLPRFDELMQWISFISLYVFPIVLIYGSLVSFMMEWLTRRVKGSVARSVLSGVGHVLSGVLFALPFGSSGFTLSCAAGALLFFGWDKLLQAQFARGGRRPAMLITLALPVMVIIGLGLFSNMGDGPPQQAPFTAEDAVAFATSGKGTVTDMFPKQAGSSQTEVNGFTITKETTVVRTGTEEYEVTFRERWSKEGSEEGSRWFTYVVTRQGMTSKDAGGDSPPYER